MNQKKMIPVELQGKTFLDPTYDPAFRELFSEKETLKHFLNGILHLEGPNEIKDLEYRVPDVSFGLPDPKMVRFDVFAKCQSGELVNIEMQRARHSFFKDRAILYSAMLAIQAKKDLEQQKAKDGEDIINNSRYQMPRVISVWICNFRLEGDSTEYHDEWNLYSKSSIEEGRILPVTDVLKYIFLELPNFKKAVSELETTEDRWLYALKNMGEEGEYPETLGDSAVRKAYERLRIMQTPAAMLERQVENMVTEAEIEERIWENTQKGLEQGLEQGRAKGAQDAKREMVKAMLAEGIPAATIARISGLPEAEILAL